MQHVFSLTTQNNSDYSENLATLHFPLCQVEMKRDQTLLIITLEKLDLLAYVQMGIIIGNKIFVTIILSLNIAKH